MRNVISLVLVSALLCFGHPAMAQDYTSGFASASCGDFFWANAENEVTRALYGFWLSGYLTGRNSERKLQGETRIDLSGVAEGLDRQWVQHWCEDNPRSDFASGAEALYEELAKQQGVEL